ncbi:MAG: hypothetical protein V1913_02430 [Fibrobacterota bacterium]
MSGLMFAHFILMAVAAIAVVAAAIIARKKGPNWFPRHRAFALAGSLCALVAFGCVVYVKRANQYPHFKSPHAVAGLVSIILLVVTPILGVLLTQGRETLRGSHRLFGRITSLAILLTAVMGALRLLQISRR